MIDKGLYKKGRVGLKGGADASTASFGASAGYSDPKTGSTGKADPKGGFNLGGGQGPTFDDAPATQVTGDQVRDASDAFIKGVRKTNPNYNPGGKVQYKKPTLGQFFSGLFSLLPGMNILKGLSGFNQRLRNTDFGRSKNLMDYLDMKKFGGYDEREMARRIRMDEAANLQKRIDAGEFGGLDTMLDEVALTGSGNQDFNRMFDVDKISNLINTGGITNTKVESSDFMKDLDEIGKGADYIGYDPDETAAIAAGTKIPQLGDLTSFIGIDALRAARERETDNIFKPVGPENTGFIEVQDTPQSQDDFFLNAVADATTFPTDDGSGISLMKRSILRNAGYNDSQIKEAFDKGYGDQLIRDIEGPPGGSLGSSAFG